VSGRPPRGTALLSHSQPPTSRKRQAIFAIGAVLVLSVGAVIAIVVRHSDGGRPDVRGSSTVEFAPTRVPKQAPAQVRHPAAIVWPLFGYDPPRLHVAPITDVRPPFRVAWVAGGTTLLEFPPAIGYGRLFLANGAGHVLAIDTRTGSVAWDHSSNHAVAASPAVGRYKHGTVYETFLNRLGGPKVPNDGEVIAFSVGWGHVRWRRHIGASETSPLLVGNRLYVGDWLGKLYALSASTGIVLWSFQTGGEVKGGLAQAGHRVFAGSYDGHLYALGATTGRLIWRTANSYGAFYSTPAVAYSRVYIGSTDANVYSFGADSGTLRWSYRTGGYVYGSPAVWRGRVYVGSYDHNFYAFDAATGEVAWRYKANGPISGSATVINSLVYFATLTGKTYALDATTGRLLWTFPAGKYTPVVADRTRLYLLGDANVYGLLPR
jgi:outer membrane protein assembly factor BamB